MLKALLFLLLISALYVLLSYSVKGSIFKQTDFSYYNYLTNSLIHGRTYITPQPNQVYDMSFYKGKIYMYWGPAPTLFILSFYLLGYASDVFYTLLAGILNVLIFLFLLKELIKFFKLKTSDFSVYFITANFAFASPNLYLSLGGRIWHTNQIIAVLYILLSLFFLFRFLNTKKILFFVLSLFFWILSALSRQTFLFYSIIFFYSIFFVYRESKYIKLYSISVVIFLITFLGYNYLRFENPLENGMRYQIGSNRYNNLAQQGKFLSTNYLSHNIQYLILNPLSFSFNKPFVKWDAEGNGIFFVYPLLITLLLFIKTKLTKAMKLFLITSGSVVLVIVTLLFFYFATGWFQFGTRYFLDVIPLLFLFAVFVIEKIPLPFKILILSYGVFVNFAGALTFPWSV